MIVRVVWLVGCVVLLGVVEAGVVLMVGLVV